MRHTRIVWLVTLVVVSGLAACGTPRVQARLDPDAAYQRQIISLRTPQGSEVDKVVWDADTPYERTIDITHSYFQIPEDAWAGPHRVRLIPELKGKFKFINLNPGKIETVTDDGTKQTFTTVPVLPDGSQPPPVDTTPDENVWLIYVRALPSEGGRQVFPAPRIEDTMTPFVFNVRKSESSKSVLSLPAFAKGTLVDAAVAVSAANMDPDATIEIWNSDGSYARRTVDARLWGALPVEYMLHHKPETFAYPVYHYTLLGFTAKDLTPGEVYNVAVRNRDGQYAGHATFSVPASPRLMDADHDGIFDADEAALARQGYDVHPLRKDIIVEVDWMDSRRPDDTAWPIVEQTFADAPVLNPDGSAGINIIVDRGQDSGRGGPLRHGGVVPYFPFLELDPCPGNALLDSLLGTSTDLMQERVNNECRTLNDFSRFMTSPSLGKGGHYALFGSKRYSGSSGQAPLGGFGLIVTLEGFGDKDASAGQASTFIHELGHNLRLGHGGHSGQKNPFKPNLPSTMAYRWQFRTPDLSCDMLGDGVPTYSPGMRAPFREATMSEADGVCDDLPADIDWSGAPPAANAPTSANGPEACVLERDDYCDADTTDVFEDWDQWGIVHNQYPTFNRVWYVCQSDQCESW